MRKVNQLVTFVMERRIVAYGEDFDNFYKSQNLKIQEKIDYVFDLVRFERQIPTKFFKYLHNSDGIYEIRVITAFKSIRILCFFDKDELVILTNWFLKKSQKTPGKEILFAERITMEYTMKKKQKELR